MNLPSVYILVLNWNGQELTRACLKSLQEISYDNIRILVIDNGSTDGSVSMINQEFPWVNVLSLPLNLGFAGGNNAGFQHIKGLNVDYVIFLNNDTIVDPEFVQPLIKPFQSDPNVGQTIPKIFFADIPDLIWYAGGKINLWIGMISHRAIRKPDSTDFNQVIETDYATGCCFCMRTEDFNQMGGFDESYSLYGEDVDLSLRIKKKQKKIMFIPKSKVWHKVSASVGGNISGKKLWRKFRAMIRLFNKHSNNLQKITIIISWVLVILPFSLCKWLYFKTYKNTISGN